MKVIVVGGGAAGMMAAIGAAEYGNEVILIEQNEKLGKKIYITGKGRCNLTNNCDPDSLMKNIVNNPKFMYSAFNSWDNRDTINMMEEEGCHVKVERGDRVFPVSDHASDVIAALKRRLDKRGVKIILNSKVTGLSIKDGTVTGIKCANGTGYDADHVVMAIGGASYPTTGSDGKSFDMLIKAGHSIEQLRPALVPLLCSDNWMREVQGLALKNVSVILMRGNKKIYNETGEMLFTGKGISGPLGLTCSSYYESGDRVYIDLKPGLDEKKLDERIQRDFKKYNNKDFCNSLNDLLPKSLIPVVVSLSGIFPEKKVNQITSAERGRLINILKRMEISVYKTAGFDEAIITRGGVNIKEIDSSTMKSKLIKGLSFAGEMIDIDALTGGFNLQIAWSTGYLAGISTVM